MNLKTKTIVTLSVVRMVHNSKTKFIGFLPSQRKCKVIYDYDAYKLQCESLH